METQCNAASLDFPRLGRRELIADFDGGDITSDGGALLLRKTEQLTAMDMMAVSPMARVIAPKFLAGVISMPFLAALFSCMGVFGGYVVANRGDQEGPYDKYAIPGADGILTYISHPFITAFGGNNGIAFNGVVRIHINSSNVFLNQPWIVRSAF